MFTVDSNAEEVFSRLKNALENGDRRLGQNMGILAHDLLASVAHRIQQKGENTAGQRMQTKSRLRAGVYSKRYSARRSERGRQTDHMDWTMDGDLFRDWQVLDYSANEATIGFTNPDNAELAGYLEDQFGTAFSPSDAEIKQGIDGYAERLYDDLDLK